MVGIGFGVTWFGYAVCLYGYCLSKQYDVTFGQLIYPTGQTSWPPPLTADAVNAQTPQPTVMDQYVPGLTLISSALASLVGVAASFLGGAAGAVGGVVDKLGQGLTGQNDLPKFQPGEVPGGFGALSGNQTSTPTPSSVTGASPWTVSTMPGSGSSSPWSVTNLTGK